MGKRQEKLGIKQTIRLEWMDKTLEMLLSGASEREIRAELKEYLAERKQSGGFGERGASSSLAVGVLCSWSSPNRDLVGFRNEALALAMEIPKKEWLPLHWAMLCAAYPFWFNVAQQVGRLLNLQGRITQAQVFARLQETYGDREVVSRNARYAVRSFFAWGILHDTDRRGWYARGDAFSVADPRVAALLLESSLLASGEMQAALDALRQSPALFPFSMVGVPVDLLGRGSDRLEVVRYGVNEEYLRVLE
jgi:hypothetical protein